MFYFYLKRQLKFIFFSVKQQEMTSVLSKSVPNVLFSLKDDAENCISKASKVVTHVICLCSPPRSLKKLTISKLCLNVNKRHLILEKEWIMYLEDIHTYIVEGEQNGVWIIAESKDIAHFIIIAYLISQKKISMKEAFGSIQDIQQSPLTENLFFQLQLWDAMGGKIDSDYPAYSSYQEDTLNKQKRFFTAARTCLSLALETKTDIDTLVSEKKGLIIIFHVNIIVNLLIFINIDGILNPFTLPSSGIENYGYCCKNCQRRIFSTFNIVNHNPNCDAQPLLVRLDYSLTVLFYIYFV